VPAWTCHRENAFRNRYHHCLDQEVEIDSDKDEGGDDAENDDAAAIVEEIEFIKGFSNDSPQLGYTQNELDLVDPEAYHDDTVHRAVDIVRERKRQFETAVLNRRVEAYTNKSERLATPSSTVGSEKELRNLHCVCSVIEHHCQGRRAEDAEDIYSEPEEEEDSFNDYNLVTARKHPKPIVMHYESSDDDAEEGD
jgi:hypothetical protein